MVWFVNMFVIVMFKIVSSRRSSGVLSGGSWGGFGGPGGAILTEKNGGVLLFFQLNIGKIFRG